MYQISCDGYILHDVRLSNDYRVIDPVCRLELNTAGSLSFKIAPTHPYYDKIKKLKSVVTLTQDGDWIFSGRVLNDETDFNNIKSIEVEGELSYLVDSNQRTAEYHNMPVKDYFKTIIDKHNAMVDDSKKFTVGSVTVEDSNDSLYRFSNYENTLDTIKDKLIDRLGGYVRTRHVGSTKYIDLVKDYETINNQQINFGKNLLDLKKYVNGEDIATAIIPLGAKLEGDEDKRLTIESVNGGVDYVYNQDAVNLYGWVFDVVTWDDVTLPENLKTKALKELAQRRLLSIRLELNAVDLHLLDVDIERIKLGDKIKVISEPHGIDDYMMVSSMSIDIDEPANNTINLGYSIRSLTDITNNDGVAQKVEQIFNDYDITSDIKNIKNEVKNVYSEISRTSDNILLKVSEEYASKEYVNGIEIGGRNLLDDTKDLNRYRDKILQDKIDGFSVISDEYSANSQYKDVCQWFSINIEPSTDYTLSFWAKGSGKITSFLYPDAVASGKSNKGAVTAVPDGHIVHILTQEYTKYIITWRTKSNISNPKNVIPVRFNRQNTDCWINIYGFKFEKGNKATDWTPAPEDVDEDISDVNGRVDDTNSKLVEINKEFNTSMSIQKDTIDMNFQTLLNETTIINGVIGSNQELLEEYIRFKGALIELGKRGNSFTAELSNEKLSFLQDGYEIAYISNNKLYITDAEVSNKMTIGNKVNGYFEFLPRSNGNLSLKYRK